ncbi:unnamed protein product, partial [Allacma fusca]
NLRTTRIACISPAKSNMSETLNTLRYAARAKRIKTKPIVVMDPREALIVSLKREVVALREENSNLRGLLHVGTPPAQAELGNWGAALGVSNGLPINEVPEAMDKEKLEKMEPGQLVDTIHQCLSENAALRQENWELIAVRDLLIRDQELVCRENERLLRKLEDVNSVCCRSPIAPARPTYSAEMLKSQSDEDMAGSKREDELFDGDLKSKTPGDGKSKSTSPITNNIPDSISRELEKRRIGKSMSNLSETYKNHKRTNSWDKVDGSRDSSGGSLKSGGSTDSLPAVQGKRVIPKNAKPNDRRTNQRSVSPRRRTTEKRNLVV